MKAREKYCSSCGKAYETHTYPLECSCGFVLYANPNPVGVALVPVEDIGFVGVMRENSSPGPALPGGFLEVGESWQKGLIRELQEEVAYTHPTLEQEVRLLDCQSTPNTANILIFAAFPRITMAEFTSLKPCMQENSDVIILGNPNDSRVHPIEDIVFPMHKTMAKKNIGGLVYG